MPTILSSPFLMEQVLPFLLVFVIIFAILDKTKILGDGKKQINAIIGFIVGLMLIAFPGPRDLIINLIPLLAVIVVILLVFMILYGFSTGDKEFSLPKGVKITLGILVGLALIIAILVFTDYWGYVLDAIFGGEGNQVAKDIFLIIVVIAAVAAVLWSGKNGGGGGGSESSV